MDSIQAKFIDTLLRYLDFQTTLCLLFLTAIGSVVYYLWTKEKVSEFKKAWWFLIPFGFVILSVYFITNLYHSVIYDLKEGSLSIVSVDTFVVFTWLQPIFLVLALLSFFIAMICATKK